MSIELTRLDGGRMALAPEALQAFKAVFKGRVLSADDAEYEDTRKVWNAMIDRRPGLIARCTGTVDVVQAVRFARQHGLLCSVRGGGHNIAGLAVCEGGLMIDMSLLRGVWVDPKRRRALARAATSASNPAPAMLANRRRRPSSQRTRPRSIRRVAWPIVRAAAADDYRWSSTILAIVKSSPFQMRRSRS